MKSVKELYMNFLELEDDLHVFNRKIGEVFFWERIRTRIFYTIFEFLVGNKELRESQSKKRSKIRLHVSSIFKPSRNPLLSDKKEIVIVGSARRLRQNDGTWMDIYTDYFLDDLEDSYLVVERGFRQTHYSPARTKNLKYLDFIDLIVYIKRAFRRDRIQFSEDDVQFLNNIRDEIKLRFGLDVNVRNITYQTLRRRKAILPLYMQFLKRVSPLLLVVVKAYGFEDIIEAAKNLTIPVVELQHGVISPYHPGYSFPGEYRIKYTFPDYLLTFGDYWNGCAEYPITETNVRSVGYPYLELQTKNLEAIEKKEQIVIISQERIGHLLSKFAVELSSRKELEYSIIYKLHPREFTNWRELYPWLTETDIEIVGSDGKSLYELFAESKIQLGVFSTAIFEGLSFKLQTYLLDLPGVEFFDPLIERGLAKKISSVDEFLNEIYASKKQVSIDKDFFFKSNSVENIVDTLKELKKSAT